MTWSDIIAIVAIIFSMPSLYLSFKIACREKRRGEYDKKLQVLIKTQDLVSARSNYYSAIQRYVGYQTAVKRVSSNDENILKVEVSALFGEKTLNDLERILSLCSQANQINYDMEILLNTIKESGPEENQKLKDVLMSEEEFDLPEQVHEQNIAFLESVKIRFLQDQLGSERKTFNYLKLDSELNKLSNQISKKVKLLETGMKEKIKFN